MTRSALDRDFIHPVPLMRVFHMLSDVSKAGFDWKGTTHAFAKLDEEVGEFRAAQAAGNAKEMFSELGDVRLATVKVFQVFGISPDGYKTVSSGVPVGTTVSIDDLAEAARASRRAEQGLSSIETMSLFGRVLRVTDALALRAGIDADAALLSCAGRFEQRFRYTESELAKQGQTFKTVPLSAALKFWKQAKAFE